MKNAGNELAWWKPVKTDAVILDTTIGAFLDQQAGNLQDRVAITIDEKAIDKLTTYTYSELKAEADLISCGLMSLGIQHGDHVAVMSHNNAEWVLLEYALAKIGAVLVTVNPALLKDEMAYVIEQSQSKVLIFTPSFRNNPISDNLKSLMPDLDENSVSGRAGSNILPKLKYLIAIGKETPPFALNFDELRSKAEATSQADLESRQSSVKSSDVAQIQYTSGTTGKPKGAMLTHRSTLNNARFLVERGEFTQDDCLLGAMPFFHTAGCICNILAMMACGGRLVTMDAFEPERMLELWDENSPTILNAVPTMITRMLDHPEVSNYKINTLKKTFTGGTNIPPSLMRTMKERTGGDPLIIMGMTECSPIITQTNTSDDFEVQISTAGTPLPHTEIKITNPETGEVCRWDESGELCIRGYLLMAGYYDMPDKTAETIDSDGWLHSGDLAELSSTGHLRIVGRLKDMIIRGGENVYPVEIEECLLNHPNVKEVQVVGVPDADLGEEICAFIVSGDQSEFNPKELQDFCREHIARHKMPKYFTQIDAMPLTANGKIQKFVLRDQATQQIESGTLGATK